MNFCDLPLQEIENHLNNPAFGYYDQELCERFFDVFFKNKWRPDVAVLAMTKYNINPFYNGKRTNYLINLLQTHPISYYEFLKILPMLCDSKNGDISTLDYVIIISNDILSYNMIYALLWNQLYYTVQLHYSKQRVNKAIHCFQKAHFHSLFRNVKQNGHKNAIAYFYYHPLFDHHLITHLIDSY
jgi:hypothetical protein